MARLTSRASNNQNLIVRQMASSCSSERNNDSARPRREHRSACHSVLYAPCAVHRYFRGASYPQCTSKAANPKVG
jgi:hypothetical protein